MSILKYEILKYFNILLMFKKTASLLISIWKTIVNQISHVLWLTCRIKYIKQEILSQRWIWHFYDKTKWFNVEKMSCRPPCYVLLSAAIPANAETICAWFLFFFLAGQKIQLGGGVSHFGERWDPRWNIVEHGSGGVQ